MADFYIDTHKREHSQVAALTSAYKQTFFELRNAVKKNLKTCKPLNVQTTLAESQFYNACFYSVIAYTLKKCGVELT